MCSEQHHNEVRALSCCWQLASDALDDVETGNACHALLRGVLQQVADAAAEGLADVIVYNLLAPAASDDLLRREKR